MTNGLPHAVLTSLFELRKRLLALFPEHKLPKSHCSLIRGNPRMRTTLGRAFMYKFEIELNSRLLLGDREALEKTFAHELAHLVSAELYGRKGHGHGKAWASVMRRMGQAPERLAKVSVPNKLARPHKIRAVIDCACKTTHFFKTRTFRKLERGVRYRCGTCGKTMGLGPNDEVMLVDDHY